jgi:hypothetical protein
VRTHSVKSAPWRDISGLQRQRHQKGSRSRLPVRSQPPKKKKTKKKKIHSFFHKRVTAPGWPIIYPMTIRVSERVKRSRVKTQDSLKD